MTDREHVDALDAELARRTEAEGRIAAALVELESHPGHQLLSTVTPAGRTESRWSQAQETLDSLWEDFGRYRATLADARAVRSRRSRPHDEDIAELDSLLLERSIEVGRVPVALPERLHTTATEHVAQTSLDELNTRIDASFDEVSSLVAEVDAACRQFRAEMAPLRERLGAARTLAEELGLSSDDPLAVELAGHAARADELEGEATTDPLGFGDGPVRGKLAELETAIAAVRRRLAGVVAVRDQWQDRVAAVTEELRQLEELSASEQQTRERVLERIAGTSLEPPRDQLPVLRSWLGQLQQFADRSQCSDSLEELRVAVRSAADELRTAHDLAAGLEERRAELRGRHEAYRAKSVRLGRAERPDILELEQRLRRLLWTRPCDLAGATQALADYQRLVTQSPGQA